MLQGNQGIAMTGQACTPDPEEMLQGARRRKEDAQENLDRFKDFVTGIQYMERDNEQGASNIAGELLFKVWQAEKDEKRWLDEIDKD